MIQYPRVGGFCCQGETKTFEEGYQEMECGEVWESTSTY